ncbi:3-galactosyl-N-acetylglucosaminide 4-alpha-L-fucosyltransferase FUT3-like [Clytia hemisphaerica]|uniref:3-galactosyl-N-acetylglucosaminide 4-alpha-L-fucosyltransferase FUT3-like n=1 Tax=Clytia hemisphaerica TaxID=252671 RepID=UPI0034D77A95
MRGNEKKRFFYIGGCALMLILTYFFIHRSVPPEVPEYTPGETVSWKESGKEHVQYMKHPVLAKVFRNQKSGLIDYKNERKKIILTFGEVMGDMYWWDVPHDFDFTEYDGTPCKYRHCQLVYDAYSYIPIADAVLFHGQDLPPVKELKSFNKIPLTQQWVWMPSESPFYYKKKMISLKPYHSVFNWTGSYRRDSDIWTPHFVVRPRAKDDPSIGKVDYAKDKDKMIIAIISNDCKSYRTQFIKKLKQYIPIDVYGQCKKEFDPSLPDCRFGYEDCKELQSRYKFTLSLENAYCKDYVTEKFYMNGLSRGNVPIVLNRATMSDPEVAPPGSYINILDFENLEVLADYLKKLAQNDKEYNKFHEWRQNYKLRSKNRMCTTCEALWKREEEPLRKAILAKVDVEKFWNYEDNCISYEEELFQKYLR